MFAKLFKYDFKAIARTQLPALFALLCMTVIGCLNAGVLCISAKNEEGFLAMISVSGFLLTIVTFAGLIMVMSLMIYVRFYQSTVTDEAYTTFTLPASPSMILGAKFLSALLWNLIISAAYVTAVCLLLLTMTACIGTADEFSLAAAELRLILKNISPDAGSVFLICLSLFVSSASRILQIFTAILFGASVVRRHKAFAAVGMIFAVNFAVNFINSLFGLTSGSGLTASEIPDFGRVLNTMMITETAVTAVIAVLCWFASAWLMKHRVNLD